MSTNRWLSDERRNRYRGKKGPNGRYLCRWCGIEVTDKRRRTWCGEKCVHEYLLRTSNSYLRAEVRKRDHGICARCGCDCYKLRRVIRAIRDGEIGAQILEELGFGRVWDLERSYWEADHKLEVVNGGGEAGLDNIETLCRACHLEKTRKLAADRAKARRRPKEP